MADGQQRSYSSNAGKAAAATPNVHAGGCPACVKTGLPILLVRPGLADRKYAASRMEKYQPLLDAHVAGPALTFGGYALRTLRAGYVMVFHETPHTADLKASGGWQAYQVSDGGYLAPYPLQTVEGAGQKAEEAFTCQRTAAYASAMLLVIPEAKAAGKVWIGYSDHPWASPVRDFYASDHGKRAARMTLVDARSASCARSIPLTESNISLIADYDQSPPDNYLLQSPYPPLATAPDMTGVPGTRPETAADVLAQAQVMIKACKGEYTPDHLKIVSLPDAIGVTAETAGARLSQCNSAQQWLLDPKATDEKRPWRLQTALSIEGLLKELDARNKAHKQKLAELREEGLDGQKVTKEQFDQMVKSGRLPEDSIFSRTGKIVAKGEWLPDEIGSKATGHIYLQSDFGVDKSTENFKEKVLAKLGKDGKYPFREFLEKHNERVKADREHLAQVEMDHKVWVLSDARKLVTQYDFARTVPMDGLHFALCVRDITHGGAMTDNGLVWYAGFVDQDPAAADAILIQALLGNQDAFFKTFTVKSTVKQIKNLLKVFEDAAKVEDASKLKLDQRLVKSFPFFDKTVAAAPVLKRMLDLVANPLATVSGGVVLGLLKRREISQKAAEQFERLMASIIDTVKPDSVATAQIRFDLALAYWRTADRRIRMPQGDQPIHGPESPSGSRAGKVKSLVLAGSLSMAMQVPESLGKQMVTVWRFGGRIGDDAKFWAKSTATAMRTGSPAFNSAAAVLQAISLARIPEKLIYGTEEERRAAAAGIITGGMGLVAATFELGESVIKEAEKAKGIAVEVGKARYLKMIAGKISAAAMFVEAAIEYIAIYGRIQKKDYDAAVLHFIQATLLAGAATATWVGANTVFSAGVSATSAGFLGLSLTGWGLILAAAGLLVGYIALLMQDTPIEEWASRCIWGGDDLDNQWGSPQREQQELNKILIGIKLELSCGIEWIKSLGASFAASESLTISMREDTILWKSAEVRLWIPNGLRDHIRHRLTFSVIGSDGVLTTIYSFIDGVGKQEAELSGVYNLELDDKSIDNVIFIKVHLDGQLFRSTQAELLISDLDVIGDDEFARNVLLQEVLKD